MGRFDSRRTKAVQYSEDDKTDNLLRRISTEQENSSDTPKGNDSDGSHASDDTEELKVAHGREIVGRSLLSPQNEVHQTAEKQYISPFDDDFRNCW